MPHISVMQSNDVSFSTILHDLQSATKALVSEHNTHHLMIQSWSCKMKQFLGIFILTLFTLMKVQCFVGSGSYLLMHSIAQETAPRRYNWVRKRENVLILIFIMFLLAFRSNLVMIPCRNSKMKQNKNTRHFWFLHSSDELKCWRKKLLKWQWTRKGNGSGRKLNEQNMITYVTDSNCFIVTA